MNNKSPLEKEWAEAEQLIDKQYPNVNADTKLKLINVYFWGKEAGLKDAREIYNDEFIRQEPVSNAPEWI
jgi:hypothetical protein